MRQSTLTKLREAASKIDFKADTFSFKALEAAAGRLADLHEANAESTFGYLLKAAVQEYANDVYKDLPVMYPNFVSEFGSKRRSEVYGGLYRTPLPRQTDAGENFQDSSFKGFEREIVNYKYGHIETFERELFDDDQTGQVRSRAGAIGEGFRILEEIYVISRLFAEARTEEDVEVPASNYNGGTVFSTGIGNRPTTFTRLTQGDLEAAHIAMRKMRDPLGRKFLVVPRILLCSPDDELEAIRIVQSPAMANAQNASTALRVNPLQGRYTVFASPFVKQYAWMIGDPSRGFVFQRRDPLEVTQENPSSGDSFKKEVYAFRGRERFGADWVEPRFVWLGNDGTVAS